MGDDIGSGLLSMAVCFDFHSTNVVQLSNWNPYFYQFRCHHPLITQLSPHHVENVPVALDLSKYPDLSINYHIFTFENLFF